MSERLIPRRHVAVVANTGAGKTPLMLRLALESVVQGREFPGPVREQADQPDVDRGRSR